MQIFIILMVLVAVALWVVALLNILKFGPKDPGNKASWILFIIIFPIVGPLIHVIRARQSLL